jgi:SAM-dependent methyltransferase
VRGVAEPEDLAATRAVYDATADLYAQRVGTEITPSVESAVDRALLGAFAELVATNPGPVVDVGCGPGRVAAFLAARGHDVVGVDLSPAMIEVARRAHPNIEFREGQLRALPAPDHAFVGMVCWYSIIHAPPSELDDAFAEMRRVVTVGAHFLAAFQTGDGEQIRRTDAVPTRAVRCDPSARSRRVAGPGASDP